MNGPGTCSAGAMVTMYGFLSNVFMEPIKLMVVHSKPS